jgi:hypothetical protein
MIEQFPLDLSSLVTLTVQYLHDQYERLLRHLCLHTDDFDRPGLVTIKAGRVKLPFRHLNQSTGGALLPFGAKRYGWFVRPYAGTGDGTLRVAYDVLGAETEGVFDFDYRTAFPNDPSGIYRGRIQPIDAAGNPIAGSECCPPFLFWLDPDHTAKNILFEIAQNGPWEWIKEADPYNCGASATYPQGLTPTYRGTVRPRLPALARPRPENLTPYVDFVFDPAKPVSTERLRLSRHNIGGAAEEGNRWYSQMTDRGIWVTENAQLYYFSQGPISFVNGKLPIYPLMDGANGVATVGFTTWNWVGRQRKLYFGSPWSARVANSTLAVRTLIGIYSAYPAHYDDLVAAMQKGVLHPSLRMRGVYPPGTPPLECFPLHMWFMVFLPPTVVSGTGPVRQDSTMLVAESPHPQNPVSVHGDYGHGFVDWFEHDKDDHTVEPRCIYRLPVPGAFGGAYSALTKKLYVASRVKHQILEIDPYLNKDANGNYLPPAVRVVLDGGAAAAALGAITPADDTFRLIVGKTQADARAAKCIDPTGLDLDARGEWCYVGSMPMGGVFRVNVVDGRYEWARDVVTTDIQSHFVNVALSDGTAGFALDTLLTCTFDNQYFGRFKAWAPAPSATQTHSAPVDWQYFAYHQSVGVTATGGTMVSVYPMAPYARKGAIVCGGSQEWIEVYTLRDAAEVAPPAAALKEGHREVAQIGGYLHYGRLGSGPSIPPKGLTPNSDVFFLGNEVTPGAAPPIVTPPVTPPTTPPSGSPMQFKSVALRNVTPDGSDLPTGVQPTDTHSPPTTTPIKSWRWKFHGSGGPGPTGTLGPAYSTYGTKKRAICDAINQLTHVNHDVDFLYTLFNAGSAAVPIFEFQPIDALPLDPYPGRDPNRSRLETWHNGCVINSTPVPNTSKATGGTFEPYTQRKYDLTFETEKPLWPNVDWSGKGSGYGGSMGGTACYNYVLRRYNGGPGGIGPKFGVFYSANGRCRVSNAIGRPDPANVPDYNAGGDTLNPAVTVGGSSELYTHAFDHVQWLLDNPKVKTPMQCSVSASHDSFSPTQDQIDLISANRLTKRPHVDVLYNGYHDGTANSIMLTRIQKTYTEDLFDGKKGWLVLLNSSADDDILQSLSWPESSPGATYPLAFHADTNVGYKWIIDEETPTSFKGRIYNALNDPSSGAVVDLGPTGAGYAAGATSVNLGLALGIGNLMPGDKIYFGFDPASLYTVTNTVLDVSRGSAVQFTPGLVKPMPATMGGSRITLVIKTPATGTRPGAPISVDVGPYSDVFTADVPMQRVTIQPGQWAPFAFDATATQPPVIVLPPAAILAFTADVTNSKPGDPVNLTFATKNAVRVLIEDGKTSQQMLDVNGTFTVNPTETTDYTCFADGADAIVAVAKLTVTVTAPPVVSDPQLDARVAKVETFLAATFKAF